MDTPAPTVTVLDVQRRLARLPPNQRASMSRRVKFWQKATVPVARIEGVYTTETMRAVNAIDWLPHGAGMGFGGDLATALKVARTTGAPHVRWGYVRIARVGEAWEVFVAPKMTRATVSHDGVKWHFAPES